jgi:hypothetical protein
MKDFPRVLILGKKEIGMKVNEGIVILGEFMDRDKAFASARDMQDII